MMITRKHLSRRTVLRGLGATVALPLLDAMVPALTAATRSAANGPRRMAVVYTPNGMMMNDWTPVAEGANFELSRIMTPLASHRERTLVLSGLADEYGWPQGDEGTGDHARASGTFLTGVHIRKTEGADLRAGISMDQVAAQVLSQKTQLGSLELAIESVEFLGGCDAGYSCAYANTIAWRTPTTPLPMINDPRAVFERLFGASDTTDPAARLARMRKERSILDSVSGDAGLLRGTLGTTDAVKLTEYLEAIRDAERRIELAETQSERELPLVDRPSGVPPTFEGHARLMFDLLTLAFQTDMTRVATFMLGREVSGRAYPEIGVPDSHHPVSHHQYDPGKLEKLSKINTFHMSQFAYFVDKLAEISDGDRSLLDNSMLLYGSGISDSNVHMHDDLPIVLVGGGGGTIKGGRHLRYPKDTPITNLYLSMLDRMDVPVESVGDSTGRVEHLSDV
jgi:hypothetical protein